MVRITVPLVIGLIIVVIAVTSILTWGLGGPFSKPPYAHLTNFTINTAFEVFYPTATPEDPYAGYSEVITSVKADNDYNLIFNDGKNRPVWFYIGSQDQNERIDCVVKEYYDSLYVSSFSDYFLINTIGQGHLYENDTVWTIMSIDYPVSKPSLIRFDTTCKGNISGYTANDTKSLSLTYY